MDTKLRSSWNSSRASRFLAAIGFIAVLYGIGVAYLGFSSYLDRVYIFYSDDRVVANFAFGAAFFTLGFGLRLVPAFAPLLDSRFLQLLRRALRLLPLDMRVVVCACFFAWVFASTADLPSYHTSLDFQAFVFLTLLCGFLYVMQAMGRWSYELLNDSAALREQWDRSYLAQLYRTVTAGGAAVAILLFIAATIGVGFLIAELNQPYTSDEDGIWMLAAIIAYAAGVIPLLARNVSAYNRLVSNATQIAAGDEPGAGPNHAIHSRESGVFRELALQMNNMQAGYLKMVESKTKSERLKSELITNVSHDLKTPLTSIINYIDLLKKAGPDSAESAHYIEVLERKSQRLKVLIDDLFEASTMASGAIELDIQEVDVAALLAQAVAEFGDRLEESSLTLRTKLEHAPAYAELDGRKTWRVFENLLHNAYKYSLPHSRIYITLQDIEHEVLLHIQNTSRYELEFQGDELFERFKRADMSRHTEGSGLGLAIAKSIVELQGGHINIDTDGDQFNVRLRLPKKQPSPVTAQIA